HPLDLEPFRVGASSDRAQVAARLDAACRDSGFLCVTGHGVPEWLCDEMLDAWGAFFDQPLADKVSWVVADDEANRGYSAPGKEGLAYSRGDETPPDLFEAFNVGRERTAGPYYERWRGFFAPNVWPDVPAGLRAVSERYEQAVAGVADALLRVMAIALDLDERWFVDRCEHAIVTTRAINYRRAAGEPDPLPAQMRMGAHTDYGILTILLADDVPGLQVYRAGTWHDVATPRGTFVCNIGDMLERWTNDRWASTLHRVVPPPAGPHASTRRRSIARFLDCAPDLVVECVPSCVSTERPARYEPVDAGAWLRAKILGGRGRTVTDVGGPDPCR
ncbi:MAG TPA: 2-oxoglutarate and iron-dependent oxygenase domain-containing protein, partial [Acidimicrobiia bacterium]|nr:2-oxoglutarate and iron-dependent oxygenase domain-containing protein [Acidimicrobiia bacterium]